MLGCKNYKKGQKKKRKEKKRETCVFLKRVKKFECREKKGKFCSKVNMALIYHGHQEGDFIDLKCTIRIENIHFVN